MKTQLRSTTYRIHRGETTSTSENGLNLHGNFVTPIDEETRDILADAEFAATVIRRMNTPSRGVDFDEALDS